MTLWVCADCTTRYAVGALACPNCRSGRRADSDAGAIPPTVTVECAPFDPVCPYANRPRLVTLRVAAPGVVELPALLCEGCGSHLTVTWPTPGAREDTMPKISRHGGPTNAAADAEQPTPAPAADHPAQVRGEHGPELVGLPAGATARAHDTEGGEESSPGNSSSASAGKPQTSPEPSAPSPRKRARTTANHSKKAQTGDPSAPSTDGAPAPDTDASDR